MPSLIPRPINNNLRRIRAIIRLMHLNMAHCILALAPEDPNVVCKGRRTPLHTLPFPELWSGPRHVAAFGFIILGVGGEGTVGCAAGEPVASYPGAVVEAFREGRVLCDVGR